MERSGQKAFHSTVVTIISDFGQPHWQTWPQKSEWIAEDGKRIGRLKWLCYKSSNICVDFLYFKKHTQFGVFSMHVRFTLIIMTRFLFLDNRTAHSMICYWHCPVSVCLSVRPSLMLYFVVKRHIIYSKIV